MAVTILNSIMAFDCARDGHCAMATGMPPAVARSALGRSPNSGKSSPHCEAVGSSIEPNPRVGTNLAPNRFKNFRQDADQKTVAGKNREWWVNLNFGGLDQPFGCAGWLVRWTKSSRACDY
jgi:hypothetical protein